MKAILWYIMATMIFFAGCSPTSSDTSGQPTPNAQVIVVGGAEVNSPSNTGKAPYTVYCALQYADTSKNSSEFNSADVTVNGVSLVRVYRDGYFQNVGKAMAFSAGDSLEFVIKHPKVGTVRGVAYVPQSVTDLSVSPTPSTANLANTATTFNLSWSPVTASYYMVQAVGYNIWETELVADSSFSTIATNASVVLEDSTGSACPYVYFRVVTINTIMLTDFASGSGIGVTGAYYNASTNMPGVSSNVRGMPYPVKRN